MSFARVTTRYHLLFKKNYYIHFNKNLTVTRGNALLYEQNTIMNRITRR